MNDNINNTLDNMKEAFTAAGETLAKTGLATGEFVANATDLTAHTLYITVDTANIGAKLAREALPSDGTEAIDRVRKAGSSFMDWLDTTDEDFVGPMPQ